MFKISNRQVIDVIKYNDNSAIIVEKRPFIDGSGKYNVSYFVINFETGKKEGITKNAYLLTKFGSAYEQICKKITNFVDCEVQLLSNRNVLAIFTNGEGGLFDTDGELIWNGSFTYNDSPLCGIALDGDYFWSFCKKENCVIRYSTENMNVDLRIGGADSTTFTNPCHISSDDDYIYVSCEPDKVRKIDRTNFVVSDFAKFNAELKRFYKFGKYSIISVQNGCYLISDDDE